MKNIVKNGIVYLFIFGLSFFTVYKASIAYNTFIDNNIPVYDGVTYEKKQIEQFVRFKGNFSLWKRLTEIKLQLPLNTVDGGFVCFLILVNPTWLINDWEVLIRSFLSVLIFSASIYHFLSFLNVSKIKRTIIISILLHLPLFYNERFGLASYIAEIPCGLILLSGYLQVLIFYRNKSVLNLLFGLTLMVIPVFFRLNFFIYTFVFLIPLFFVIKKHLKDFNFMKNSVILIYIFFLLVATAVYFIQYYDYFIGYYVKKEIEWDGHGDFIKSIYYFVDNVYHQIGLTGFLAFIYIICLKSSKISNSFSYPKYLLVYPFITQFFIVVVINKAVNVPHVTSAISLSIIIIFLTFRMKNQIIFNNKLLFILTLLFIGIFNLSFYIDNNNLCKTLPEHEASFKAVQFITNKKKIKNIKEDFKYISFVDDVAEVPIDVALYKKEKVYLKSKNHFYYHDYGWYHNIDKNLNTSICLNHYTSNIDQQVYDLIIMDEGINKNLKQYPFSRKIHSKVRSYLNKSTKYKVIHTDRTLLNGEIKYYVKVVK